MIYGYTRISKKTQSIDRQVRNILEQYPKAEIKKETFTGTKVHGRKEFEKLVKISKPGDTIVFDSVSRMARNTEDGIKLYFDLYNKGVSLVFLKEHHIDTDAYEDAMKASGISVDTSPTAEGELVSDIISALNKFMQAKVRADISKAFEQAEKEVLDLRDRTREGIETARLAGKQIGQKEGAKLTTKKSLEKKDKIRKLSKDFDGTLKDVEVIGLLNITRNTYYKYKRELKLELI